MPAATGRLPMRASHLHFMVEAPERRTLVTHIFVRGDELSGRLDLSRPRPAVAAEVRPETCADIVRSTAVGVVLPTLVVGPSPPRATVGRIG